VQKRLTPSPRRFVIIVFVFCLWLVLTRGSAGMLSFLCAIFVVGWMGGALLPGAAWLDIDSQGFTVRYWFKEERFRWTDIKAFKVMTQRLFFIPVMRSVGFTFSETYPKRNVVLRIAGAIAAFDRRLADNYGMKARELAGLLELCRREAVGQNPIGLAGPQSPFVRGTDEALRQTGDVGRM
jgi:hypothetical protein